MFRLIRESITDFKDTYQRHLLFALIYMLLTSILFVPLLTFIFNRMLIMLGTTTVVNYDVYKIALSHVGIISLLVVSFIIIFILFIQLGVYICISQQKYFNKDIWVTEAILTTLSKTHKLVGFGLFQILSLLIVFVPFIDSPIIDALFNFNFDIYMRGHLYNSQLFTVGYVLVFLVMIYVAFRWVFTIHFIMIENKTIRKAIKESMRLTKQAQFKIVLILFLINLIIFALSFTLIYLVSLIPEVLDGHLIGDLIDYYLASFSSFISIIFTLILIPINIIILTRLFYKYHYEQVENQDHLKAVRNNKLANIEKKTYKFVHQRKYLVLIILMIYLTGMFLVNHNVNNNLVYLKWNVEIAAHRGDAVNAPENSMSSVKKALEANVDAIEVDVQITKDGIVVLNHDPTLNRVAGVPHHVKDLTYEELQQVDIGSSFSGEFTGERIPTLESVLKEVKNADRKLMIELKPDQTQERLGKEVARLIEEYEMIDHVYVSSFNYESLQVVREANPEIRIGQIIFRAVGDLSYLDVDFYTIHQTMLSEQFIENAHEDNRDVWVWSVNINRTADQILQYDVDGIITKTPDVLLKKFNVFSQEDNEENGNEEEQS